MADLAALSVVALPLWFVVSVWAGIDATRHSSHNAFLWGFSVFVGGVLGLALYLNLGRDEPGVGRRAAGQSASPNGVPSVRTETVTCPNCHSLEESGRDTCRFCGESL
ncbi:MULTISPECIES: hypothetical protein [Haloferax]|uniref:Cardiolipin synthase N-terminal domain-containing protein n=1 Tax=Haloferax massiliensis TaxID=1476858 RepID=A0A0D6JP80_9EURY|nr:MULTISPECIES: hypothetical protein [Haloferax]MDS0242646.1 hypothetical protein [Haloferax sp. S2CR25]MDS0445767.1 hypothetical protein [Haloferax sp. S2CR25-2]CQR49355.1 hypothetical protein BN996_00815 [Haloferax massiliensis]